MEDAPETTELSYWKKIPTSVLLAICAEINKSQMAQLRASVMETEVSGQLRAQLLTLANMTSNSEVGAWIKRELEAYSGETS